jgi:hypothetical protein
MPIDSRARAFVEANIEHYRKVALAVQGFESEVESVLRSLLREFKEQLTAIGIQEEDVSFKVILGDDASETFLKGKATDIEIGVALQCREEDDHTGRFAVYSFVWVKNSDLRKSLDHHIAARLSLPFVHEFESSTTYISMYLDVSKTPQVIDLLRESFATLIECLFELPEFCKSYSLSGPIGKVPSTGQLSGPPSQT